MQKRVGFELRTSPKKIVSEADTFLSVDNNRQLVSCFLEKYSQCEVYTRSTLIEYKKSIGEPFTPEEIGMDAKRIRIAFSESGVNFCDKKLITRIYGAEDSPGRSSCRWLRNKVSHELMRRALKEVCERNNDLLADMEEFICEVSAQT